MLMTVISSPAIASPRTNFRRTVHGAEEAAFLLKLAPTLPRDLLVDQARGEVRVDRHLLARHRVQAEPCRHLRDAAGALGDHHEVHDQEDGEQDDADHDVAAHQEAAECLHHVPGRQRAFITVAQDQPRGRDVEREAQEGGEQQQRGEAGEVERALQEHCDHQHEHGRGD